MVWGSRKLKREEGGEQETELSATLLPVLVKCCVLSKRQPRMCQPSHLTLPNGLLNADIKLTRSFALPLSSLSSLRSHYLSFSPCPSPCHSLVLSLSLSLVLLLCLSTSRSPSFPFFPPVAVSRLLLNLSFSYSSLKVFFFAGCLFTDPFFFNNNKKKELNISVSVFSLFLLTGSIMPSTLRIPPSPSPCCTSCQHHSTAWPTPLCSAWTGIGVVY